MRGVRKTPLRIKRSWRLNIFDAEDMNPPSQRSLWMKQFGYCWGIFFVVDLDNYDKRVDPEDEERNRYSRRHSNSKSGWLQSTTPKADSPPQGETHVQAAFRLFSWITNLKEFSHRVVLVVFLLTDPEAFKQTLAIKPLSTYFPEYSSSVNNPEEAIKFLRNKFQHSERASSCIFDTADWRGAEKTISMVYEASKNLALQESGIL
ncbi:hypothetical protein B0H63DRAFT_181567 [Podospora didyma]|uniref:Uncharacterized protein n=1 Tax=Podospora didyma TaxID=330526 RepID=A0AAE0NPT5_9PEZI|nr:hypothetical protein B0H63DRAFT_181567 [Podospora didyma]